MHFARTVIILALLGLPAGLPAQQELRFPAGALPATTYRLLGDSTAWPVLISLASRDEADNSFILGRAALDKARQFKTVHTGVLAARKKLEDHVRNGAKVFCPAELDQAIAGRGAYDAAVRTGSISDAVAAAEKFRSGVDLIARLVTERRQESIDARLTQKTGTVDRRKGLLGDWNGANVGDLFAAFDALRTGSASLAQLAFTDGMDVTVDAATTVVIRESKMDKLDNTIKRDMALTKGSLLTKLSARSKEMNRLTLQAGSSESRVQSGKFWVSSGANDKVRLSNYDGTVAVTSNKQQVQVGANQGTVVEKGKAPLKPVPLLEAPRLRWPRLDSVIYDDRFLLEWSRIEGSSQYQIEISPSQNFDRQLARYTTTQPQFQLTNIPTSIIYLRLQSVDPNGLRGMDSPSYVVIRNQDTQPPPIHIDGWETDRKYTVLDVLPISGRTEPGARLTQGTEPVAVDADGRFLLRVPVTGQETRITLSVLDPSGNRTGRTLSVMRMDPDRVGRIEWNCPMQGDVLTPASDLIGARGVAYPRVRVTAVIGTESSSVQTSSSGEWALSLKPTPGARIRFEFESMDDAKIFATKTYTVAE